MDITRDEKKSFKALEKNLGYSFKQRDHLKRALTHRSYANEHRLDATDHNERYEFLGDTVLDLVVSDILMHAFPQAPEGDLSKYRAAIVNEAQLAELARAIDVGDYLYVGKGEEQTGGRDKASILSDAYEALLGAMYLDRGLAKVRSVIERHYAPIIELALSGQLIRDYKTKLQEVAQGRFKKSPRYRMANEHGPDHEKRFEVHLFIGDELYGSGAGTSKKSAEQEAAKQALQKLESM